MEDEVVMRTIRRLLGMLVLVVAVVLGYQNRATLVPQATAKVNQLRTELVTALDGNWVNRLMGQERDVATPSSSTTTTPMEPIVEGMRLSPTYYYHYSATLPAAGRRVFADAVSRYNATGIIHLVQGTAPAGKNSITFSVYHKRMAQNSAEIELGHGGPSITQRVSLAGTHDQNNANASLNADYGGAFSDAVATHELGHALGLDHSQSLLSVMYPISQGRSQLSAGDIAGLKAIYGSTKK